MAYFHGVTSCSILHADNDTWLCNSLQNRNKIKSNVSFGILQTTPTLTPVIADKKNSGKEKLSFWDNKDLWSLNETTIAHANNQKD